ncbi:hypothetical protein EJ05DRAFT_501897 [Pseudovirgaria hyperparasitica]|uniref:Zn(2)-C6 fungal-type domain-containing protein n=1 Tax=Pseudovirgaria hyperparasitica TaxID=470096 RepID=A0A6A6W1I0_9PEZI|nr:uncharacterized protein EJ05DRAFT_501897 [Pseudovirgaria hyperparasitica]KAF2756393.1 hypothetical protein EJ05DRAFT_501897 [Pseudovirgaria hyperparasitica]
MEANNGLAPPPLHLPDGAWTQGPVSLARGRSAKDPSAQTATYTVHSLEEFETALRAYLDDPPPDPEHAEGHFHFWLGASFLVHPPVLSPQERVALEAHARRVEQQAAQQLQEEDQQQDPTNQSAYPPTSLDAHYAAAAQAHRAAQRAIYAQNAKLGPRPDGRTIVARSEACGLPSTKISMSILEALQPTADPKDRMRKQRAIAKACIEAIQRVDGYRYSFHNNWNSREDDAFRFSYYCNDSLLNKDRAANGKGQKVGKRATKPVYDCRGVLAVKFSSVKQSLEVHYKHIPKHKTYEERAPPPRRDSKRRKRLEADDPDAVPQKKPRPPPKEKDLSALPKKKKDKANKEQPADSIESSLRAQSLQSLLELIRVDGPTGSGTNGDTAPAVDAGIQIFQATQASPSGTPDTSHPAKRRPRLACDQCRSKRTACDHARPTCKSCNTRSLQCVYNDMADKASRQSLPATGQLAQAPSNNISTPNTTSAPPVVQKAAGPTPSDDLILQKMKADLEAAQLRIAQLEAEKNTSPTVSTRTVTPNTMNNITPQPRHREVLHQQYQQMQQNNMHPRHDYPRQPVQPQGQAQQAPAQPSPQQHQHQTHHMQASQQTQWPAPTWNSYQYPQTSLQAPRQDQWNSRTNTGNLFRQ